MQRELVERAIRGDYDAFAELVRASASRQYAIATLIVRDGDRAQDAVQEALVAAWRGLSALRDPHAWDAWLHRLTVRACYAAARREKRRTVVELQGPPGREPAAITDDQTALAERDRLERELGRLPIDQRAILVLHFYVGLPLTEAAAVLDIARRYSQVPAASRARGVAFDDGRRARRPGRCDTGASGMSDDVRFERLLAVVLADAAPTRAPDRLVPDILAATSLARPRPRWLAFAFERSMRLNTKVVVGSRGTRAATLVFVTCLAVALVVGTVVGAASLIPTPTPTPNPTIRPSPATSMSPLSTFRPLADRSGCCLGNPNYLPGFGYALPAGWTQVADTFHSEVFIRSTGQARGTVALHWAAAIATNDRACAGVVAPGVGTTAAEMVAALENDPRLVASVAQPTSKAGYTGQTLDLRLAPSWSGTCNWSGGKPAALLVTAGAEKVGPSFGITGSERVRVFILDVYPGTDPKTDPSVVAWFGITADEANFDAELSEAMPLVDSFNFHP